MMAPDQVAEVRERLVQALDWQGPVFEISAIAGQGCRELCYAIWDYLESLRPPEAVDPDVRFDRDAEAPDGDAEAQGSDVGAPEGDSEARGRNAETPNVLSGNAEGTDRAPAHDRV